MVLSVINRYIRIILKRASLEIMNLAEYRTSFIMGTLGAYGYTLMEIIFIYVLLNQFETIGGWNKFEILLGFVTMQFTAYVYFMFFQGHDEISDQIRTGKLDMFLLKPLNSYFSLNFQKIDISNNIAGILLQVCIFIYCFRELNLEVTYMLVLYIFSTLIGALILNIILTIIHFFAFWMVDPDVLFGRLFYEVYEDFSRYPITIFKDPMKTIFLTIFPMGTIVYIPTYFLVRGFDLNLFVLQITVFIVFFVLSLFIYRMGLKSYSGASS